MEGEDFYAVREVLAGDGRGPAFRVHASRLIKFDFSRTSADLEHARKLPDGYGVVQDILGHRDGMVLVKWLGVVEPRWQVVDTSLQQVLRFKQYCVANNLTRQGVEKRPVGGPAEPGMGAGEVGGGKKRSRKTARCTFSGNC